MKIKQFYLSASLISSDLSDLEKTIKELNKGKIDFFHFDVMDGAFVPRFGLHPELLTIVKKNTKTPINIHMMVNDVEPYIEIFALNGADYITFHIESTKHVKRIIDIIHSYGVKAGVALNPGTPLSVLDYILDDLDLIMIMAINPGIVGHAFIPITIKKIVDLKEKIKNFKKIIIEVDGGVNIDTAPQMIKAGGDILVCGSQSIFKKGGTVPRKIINFRKNIIKNL